MQTKLKILAGKTTEIWLFISGSLTGIVLSLSPWSLISNNFPSIFLISVGLGYTFVRSNRLVVNGLASQIFGNWLFKLIFIGITFINTIAILYNKLIGQKLFYSHPISSTLFIVVFLFIIALVEFTLIGDLFYISSRVLADDKKNKKLSKPTQPLFGWLIILIVIWGGYLYASFPGLMTLDSFSQWKQAGGQQELSNWFPAFHTLVIRISREIWDNPATIIMFQILFMALVLIFGMQMFHKKGISTSVLTFYVVFFALLPTNGILIVNMQKDIPYAISFIWLELLLMGLIWDSAQFQHRISSLIALFLSLTLTGLFRHNGAFVTYISVFILIVFSITQKRYLVIFPAIASVIAIILVTGPLYKSLQVAQTPVVFSKISPFQDLAGVYIRGGDLSLDTQEMMESVMPFNYWLKRFDPYSADKYLFPVDDDPYYLDYKEKIDKIPLSEVLQNYVDTFFRSPLTIFKTRVAATSLIWDLTRPDGLYDYPVIWNPTMMEEWGKEFNITNIEWHPNIVTNLINEAANLLGRRVQIAYYIINGAAISNAMIFLLFFFWIINRKIQNYVILIPFVANFLALALSIPAQDFRYIWQHNIFASLLFLFTIGDLRSNSNTGEK